jgi:hypothetical protein
MLPSSLWIIILAEDLNFVQGRIARLFTLLVIMTSNCWLLKDIYIAGDGKRVILKVPTNKARCKRPLAFSIISGRAPRSLWPGCLFLLVWVPQKEEQNCGFYSG